MRLSGNDSLNKNLGPHPVKGPQAAEGGLPRPTSEKLLVPAAMQSPLLSASNGTLLKAWGVLLGSTGGTVTRRPEDLSLGAFTPMSWPAGHLLSAFSIAKGERASFPMPPEGGQVIDVIETTPGDTCSCQENVGRLGIQASS